MLERSNPKPLYLQLTEIIREKIHNGEWETNNPIPSENELSKIYGLSRMTVRSVITQFVSEGLLYRVPGKGTFVAEPKITAKSLSYAGIREQLEQMGYAISTRILSTETIDAAGQVAENLALESGTPVYMIKRLRFIEKNPLSLHVSYMPVKMCEGFDSEKLEKEQLCVVLKNDYGLSRGKVVETLESSMAKSAEAKLLEVKAGHPLLLLEDIIYSADGIPFEYSKVLFRGDKIKIKMEF
ncbi:MAG TPA: GntR family transcriptional regulator [Clostridia bacterium]|nr:GntR family transcriptional regulator [Clostridia bacterium]